MLREGLPSTSRQGHPRARLLADEILSDRDVARALQCGDMAAEIAVGRLQDRFQPGEFDPFALRYCAQRGHDFQSRLLMDDLVRLHHLKPACSSPLEPNTCQDQKG